MWCDDFDADLFKVVPHADAILAPVADVPLWTYGNKDSNGELAHPAVWNGYRSMLAFFTLHPDRDPRPGDFYYVGNDPLIRCTFAEAARDCYVHNYALIVNGTIVLDTTHITNSLFYPLMADVRGWDRLGEQQRRSIRRRVRRRLEDVVRRFRALNGSHQ